MKSHFKVYNLLCANGLQTVLFLLRPKMGKILGGDKMQFLSALFTILFFTSFFATAKDNNGIVASKRIHGILSETSTELLLETQRCISQKNEPIVYMEQFQWNQSPSTMNNLFDEIYKSGARLKNRAYLENHEIILPFETTREIKPVSISNEFIINLTQRIEETLRKGFAEHVFFSDMGHSHFYFDNDHWDLNYSQFLEDLPTSDFNQFYEKAFADPEMLILFHTAEQLKIVDDNREIINDPYIRFRWWHRNPTIPNNRSDSIWVPTAPDDSFNTVREISGFNRWGGGFYISSSNKGCFPYKNPTGKILYFDISLTSIPMGPGSSQFNGFNLQNRKNFDHWNSSLFWSLPELH